MIASRCFLASVRDPSRAASFWAMPPRDTILFRLLAALAPSNGTLVRNVRWDTSPRCGLRHCSQVRRCAVFPAQKRRTERAGFDPVSIEDVLLGKGDVDDTQAFHCCGAGHGTRAPHRRLRRPSWPPRPSWSRLASWSWLASRPRLASWSRALLARPLVWIRRRIVLAMEPLPRWLGLGLLLIDCAATTATFLPGILAGQ